MKMRHFRRFAKIFLAPLFRLVCWFKVKNKKVLKTLKGRPIVFCCTHQSNLDVPVMFCALNSKILAFWAKSSLLKPNALGWALRHLGAIEVNPKNELALMKDSIKHLKEGGSLIVFPTGHRSFSAEDSLAIQNGALAVSARTNATIIPVVFNKKPKLFSMTTLKFGEPIFTDEFKDKKATKDDISALGAKLQAQIEEMKKDFVKIPRKKKWQKIDPVMVRMLLIKDNKIALMKRNKGADDYYVFIGGHIDEGEGVREALIREAKEECDLDVNPTRELYRYKWRKPQNKWSVGMQSFWLCDYISGEISKTDAEEYTQRDESSGTYEPVWVDVAELKNLDLRPKCIKSALIKDYEKTHGRLSMPSKFIKDK
ncbi:MAG: 1-acyl-sn-glycerol-3-phosphate acyltransferase [Christensenellaceae bacterium]|nr:1-acyl-sn-glycerol-3-phosphate acyltransferase [Christensenellaceae bacterium]